MRFRDDGPKTNPHGRAPTLQRIPAFVQESRSIAERLRAEQARCRELATIDMERAVRCGRLASRADALAETFESWFEIETTHEQRAADLDALSVLAREVRQLFDGA